MPQNRGAFGAFALVSQAFAPAALAVETNFEMGAAAAVSGFDSDVLDDDAALNFDGFVRTDFEHLLDNGVEIGGAVEVRAQGDAENRPGFAGRLGACTPGLADCASVAGAEGPLAPQSPTTGLASFGAPLDAGPYGAVEAAYVYANGGWGEVVLGRDAGVAARLDARPPTSSNLISAGAAPIDPTGANIVRARNDVSGTSLKASYLTPRLVGVRLGVSYTPEAESRSVDWNMRAGGDGVAVAEIEQVVEVAASFARRFRSTGDRIRLGATFSYGRDGSNFSEYGDYRAYGAGAEWERGDWRAGARYLRSNNAWAAGEGDYSALEVGVERAIGDWRIGADYAVAQDALINLSGEAWTLSGALKVNDHVDLGFGYVAADTDIPVLDSGARFSRNTRGRGVFATLSVRN